MTLILSLRGAAPAATISAMVAGGFLVADIVQGKYFWYHGYPAAAFCAAAACVVIFPRLRQLREAALPARAIATGLYGLGAGAVVVLFLNRFADGRPIMHDLTWAGVLSHPRALAVSPQEDTSFPLARRIGAVWVGHSHSQWIARYTRFALGSNSLTSEERKLYLEYHRSDLDAILREIRDKRPEIIIEDVRPTFSWLEPELNALQPGFLDDYAVIADEGAVRVLRARWAVGPVSPCPPSEGSKKLDRDPGAQEGFPRG